MKMVFKGVVNDAEYTNVHEYNKALREAIKSGQPVVASSSTNSVCEHTPASACDCQKTVTAEQRYQTLLETRGILPEVDLFEFDGDDARDNPYADRLQQLFSRDNAEEIIRIMKNESKEVVDIYLKDLAKEIEDVEGSVKEIKDIAAEAKDRLANTLDTIEQLENQLDAARKAEDSLRRQDKVCDRALNVLSFMNKYYNHVAWRLTHKEEKPDDDTPGVQGREAAPGGASDIWGLSPEQIEAGRRLIQAIFG